MPRDPNRIPKILTLIQTAWEEFPDQRLGQLIVNVVGNASKTDLFYIEDDVLKDDLEEWIGTSKNWRPRPDDNPNNDV